MVHPTWMYLNKAASDLLGLTKESKVIFKDSDETNPDGSVRIFIGKRRDGAFKVMRKGNGYRICSKPMSHDLANALQGFGTYGIEPDGMVTDLFGNKWYSIFYRKYGN